MKNWKQGVFFGLVAIIALGFGFIGCDNKSEVEVIDYPKDQTAILTNLFGEGYSATVKGHLTNTQWYGVADKIENILNSAYTNGTFLTQVLLVGVCYDGLTVVVEKTSAYGKYKVAAGEFRTLYLNYGFLKSANDANLQTVIVSAVEAMDSNTAKTE